jgi:outer membrane protein assembly factor BamB
LIGLDAETGEVAWSTRIARTGDRSVPWVGAVGDAVAAVTDRHVTVLDATTGELRWQADSVASPTPQAAFIGDERVIVPGRPTRSYALEDGAAVDLLTEPAEVQPLHDAAAAGDGLLVLVDGGGRIFGYTLEASEPSGDART